MLKLRDRDAILTKDNLIFRVYGYLHPPDAYVCDPEYVSPKIFKSINPRARRGKKEIVFYKFFADEGLKLVFNKFPQYTVYYEPLQKCLVGVKEKDITEIRKPDIVLKKVLNQEPNDALLKTLHDVYSRILSQSGLSPEVFGIFGSILHGFYNPKFSDLDFIIYGKENINKLCKTLESLYDDDPFFQNEFDYENVVKSKDWKFVNYSLKEYVWHQRRKMIYCYFNSKNAKRIVKAEFEPVKKSSENINEYNTFVRIYHLGWIKTICEITDDTDAPYIPSIYKIKIKEILDGPNIDNIIQIFSYLEEFRMQTKKGEQVLVEGNLEKVVDGTNTYYQITLSYGPRYYEQTLKVIET